MTATLSPTPTAAAKKAALIIADQGSNAMNFATWESDRLYAESKTIPQDIQHHNEIMENTRLCTFWGWVVLEIFTLTCNN